MGAGSAVLATSGPLPAVGEMRASGSESGPQEPNGGGACFANALDGARDSTPSSVNAASSQAAPAGVDTTAHARATPAPATARSGAQAEPAPASAAQNNPAPGGASRPAAPRAAKSPAQDVAAILPVLDASAQPKDAPSAADADASAPPAEQGSAKRDQTGATATDPVGFLAMIFGAVPAAAGGAADAADATGAEGASISTAAAVPAAAIRAAGVAGKAAVARAAAADATVALPGLQPSAAPSGSELVAALALLPDAAASGAAGGDNQAAQSTGAPSGQALADLMRSLGPSMATAPIAEQAVAVPVGSAGWGAAVAAQVHWLAGSGVTSATLHLAPEHLGPVRVFIDLQSSQVNVSFSAAHADTRAALEQALPKLREMFATGGLALGQASVQQEARPGSQSAMPARVTHVTESAATPLGPGTQALGLVDEYA